VKLIAETAWHHEGDFEFMKSLVNDLCQTPADIIKLHLTLDKDEYMATDHAIYQEVDKWLLSASQWQNLIEIVRSNSKELMLLLNDVQAVEFASQFSPEYIEVHSVCLNDIHLLHAIKGSFSEQTPIILGVGGTDLYEIEAAINVLGHNNIIMMFGFQNYPTRCEDINFNKIRKIINLYPQYQFGYADHTGWDHPDNLLITVMGASLGMQYVEKHVTTLYGEKRTDWSAAISIDMFNELAGKLVLLQQCNGDGSLKMNQGEKQYSIYGPMKKAAVFAQDVKKDQVLTLDMLAFKRTGGISDLSQTDVLSKVGQKLASDMSQGELVLIKHFSDNT